MATKKKAPTTVKTSTPLNKGTNVPKTVPIAQVNSIPSIFDASRARLAATSHAAGQNIGAVGANLLAQLAGLRGDASANSKQIAAAIAAQYARQRGLASGVQNGLLADLTRQGANTGVLQATNAQEQGYLGDEANRQSAFAQQLQGILNSDLASRNAGAQGMTAGAQQENLLNTANLQSQIDQQQATAQQQLDAINAQAAGGGGGGGGGGRGGGHGRGGRAAKQTPEQKAAAKYAAFVQKQAAEGKYTPAPLNHKDLAAILKQYDEMGIPEKAGKPGAWVQNPQFDEGKPETPSNTNVYGGNPRFLKKPDEPPIIGAAPYKEQGDFLTMINDIQAKGEPAWQKYYDQTMNDIANGPGDPTRAQRARDVLLALRSNIVEGMQVPHRLAVDAWNAGGQQGSAPIAPDYGTTRSDTFYGKHGDFARWMEGVKANQQGVNYIGQGAKNAATDGTNPTTAWVHAVLNNATGNYDKGWSNYGKLSSAIGAARNANDPRGNNSNPYNVLKTNPAVQHLLHVAQMQAAARATAQRNAYFNAASNEQLGQQEANAAPAGPSQTPGAAAQYWQMVQAQQAAGNGPNNTAPPRATPSMYQRGSANRF